MHLVIVTPPAAEPVSVAEAHARIDASDEDTLIGSLITAARELVETETARRLITQTLDGVLDKVAAVCGG